MRIGKLILLGDMIPTAQARERLKLLLLPIETVSSIRERKIPLFPYLQPEQVISLEAEIGQKIELFPIVFEPSRKDIRLRSGTLMQSAPGNLCLTHYLDIYGLH